MPKMYVNKRAKKGITIAESLFIFILEAFMFLVFFLLVAFLPQKQVLPGHSMRIG